MWTIFCNWGYFSLNCSAHCVGVSFAQLCCYYVRNIYLLCCTTYLCPLDFFQTTNILILCQLFQIKLGEMATASATGSSRGFSRHLDQSTARR